MHVVVYSVSGHFHTLDMALHEHSIRDSTCSMHIGRDVMSIVAALYPVDVLRWVDVNSARGMCSMNTTSWVKNEIRGWDLHHCDQHQ